MQERLSIAALTLAVASAASGTAAARDTLVVVAPGYPGSTEQAQPVMDEFAAAVAAEAGLPAGALAAVYHPDLDAGLAALADAGLALVPLALYVEHGDRIECRPQLEVIQRGGAESAWSLVAARGRVAAPSALDGWEIAALPGYSPGFVRRVALGGWGELPASVEVRFVPRVLSALRRAAAGEPVAVLLDATQTAAVDRLPFANDLEVVHRSGELPGPVVCRLDERLDAERAERIVAALLALGDGSGAETVLETMRVVGFAPADVETLAALASRATAEP